MEDDETFRVNVRVAREYLRLSQSELAARLAERGMSVPQQTVARIESGGRRVTIGEAAAISGAVETPLHDLLDPHFVPKPTFQEALQIIRAKFDGADPRAARAFEQAMGVYEATASGEH